MTCNDYINATCCGDDFEIKDASQLFFIHVF